MDFYNSIGKKIDELKKNQYDIITKKTPKNMLITTSIKFPKEILKKRNNRNVHRISINNRFIQAKIIPKIILHILLLISPLRRW